MLFYDAYLVLSHLRALFDTLHAHATRAVRIIACGIQNIEERKKRFKFVTTFKQAKLCHVTTFRRVF